MCLRFVLTNCTDTSNVASRCGSSLSAVALAKACPSMPVHLLVYRPIKASFADNGWCDVYCIVYVLYYVHAVGYSHVWDTTVIHVYIGVRRI